VRIVDNENDETLADPAAQNSGRSRSGHANDSHDTEGEEDMQGDVKGTWKGKRRKRGMGKGNVTEDGTGKGLGKGN
jgi:hypothetical protein